MKCEQQSHTILVIANDQNIRTIVRLALEKAGYAVQEARAVEECCAAQEGSYSLVVVDLSKPQDEEIDAILSIKREHPDMPIIAIRGGSRCINRSVEDNPVEVARTFWKPFDLGDLVTAVEQELKHTTRGLTNVQ